LERHLAAEHGAVEPSFAGTRAKERLLTMNRSDPGNWDRYGSHRQAIMDAVCKNGEEGDIAVFGAGNCADIDLVRLSSHYREIHLIDLDALAIERARDQLPSDVKRKVVLHGDVDLSGFLGELEAWGESFPPESQLAFAAVNAARSILQSIGRSFDTTLSSCVMSQLIGPYQRSWALSPENWDNVDMAISAVHLSTLAGATRPGGRGFLAFDVLSSDAVPELKELCGESQDTLDVFITERLEDDDLPMQPDPRGLIAQMTSPGLGSLFAAPELTRPWLWDIGGGAIQLVYGLAFRGPS
jgi:hypothetical protein